MISVFLVAGLKGHYGDLSDVDSTFQSMFKNFSNIFDSSAAPRKLSTKKPTSAVQEVQFTDANGNLKSEDQIKQEIESKFEVQNAEDLGIDSVVHDLVSKGIPQQSGGRKLGGDLETKIQRAMNLGLGGELLSEDPQLLQKDSVKKSKNWVEFDDSADINDHREQDFKTKNGKGSIREKTWGSHSVKHRIGENGLKSLETVHKTSKVMKRSGPAGNGESSFQEMSFSSSSSNAGDAPLKMDVAGAVSEDPEMGDMFFPEDQIKQMNEIQNRMMGNLDDLFTQPEEFAKVDVPRELRLKRRKRRSHKKKNKKRSRKKRKKRNRKLEGYDYEYPETVYGFNSHVIENPVNCPDCGSSSYVPTVNTEYYGPDQQLNQFQENNYAEQQNNMQQFNTQQNNVNHFHNHHYHPQHAAFDPALSGQIKVDDYDKMEQLYLDYLNAVIQFNHETPTMASPRAVNKQMTVLEHQLVNQHHRNPYFGTQAITLPPMMSTDSELALHLPVKIAHPVIPKTTIHHHYMEPSYNEYTFQGIPAVPVVAAAPTPDMIHNYQVLMDMPHPMAPVVEASQAEETHTELQHVKKDLEIEFKNDLEIEVGKVMKHEDDIQKQTDKEIDHLMDLTRSVQNSMSTPAPTLNVEHTVMGVDGHQIHETKDGEIIVENNSESHSIKGGRGGEGSDYDSSAPSEKTEVIQKVTPIIIGNPGAFGGSDDSYSGSSYGSYSEPSTTSSYKNDSPSDGASEEIIIQKGDKVVNQQTGVLDNNSGNVVSNISDIDEDRNKIVDSSSTSTSQVHAKNSIYNEKNTHIVHHMGPPSDSKVLNIHLNLLSDGKGGFYFQGKDGKPVGTAGTLADKYDVLNHQLDTIRVKEVENFKHSGKMSQEGQIGEADQLDNMGDENIVTQINTVDDLHQVTDEDLKNFGSSNKKVDSLEASAVSSMPSKDDVTADEIEGTEEQTKQVIPLDQEQDESVDQDMDQISGQDSFGESQVVDEDQISAASSSKKSVQELVFDEDEEIQSQDQASDKGDVDIVRIGDEEEVEKSTQSQPSEVQVEDALNIQSEEVSGQVDEDALSSQSQVESGLVDEDALSETSKEESGLVDEDALSSQSQVESGLVDEELLSRQSQGESGLVDEDALRGESQVESGLVDEDQLSSRSQTESGVVDEDALSGEVQEDSQIVDVDALSKQSGDSLQKSETVDEDALSGQSEVVDEDALSGQSQVVDEDALSGQSQDQSETVDEDALSGQVEEQSDLVDEDALSSQSQEQSGTIDEDALSPTTQEQSEIVDEDALSEKSQDQSETVDEDALSSQSQTQSESVDEDALSGKSQNQSETVDEDALSGQSQSQSETVDEDALSGQVEEQSGIVDEDVLSGQSESLSGTVNEDTLSNLDKEEQSGQSDTVDEDAISQASGDNLSQTVDEDNISGASEDNLSQTVDEDQVSGQSKQSGVIDVDDQSQLDSQSEKDVIDIDDESGAVNEDDISKSSERKLENLREKEYSRNNPFKRDVPVFQELARNFLVNPIAKPRSMKQIAAEFDKNFADVRGNAKPDVKFVEPRELFEDLDVTSRLRSNLGIGKEGHLLQEHRNLF